MGKKGEAKQPTKLDPWHDPWAKPPSLADQMAMVHRSLESGQEKT